MARKVLPSQDLLNQVMLAIISGARVVHQVSGTVRVVFWRSLISQWVLIPLCLISGFAWPGLVTPGSWPFLHITTMFAAEVYANAYVKKKRLAALRELKHGATLKEDFFRPSRVSDDAIPTAGAPVDIHSESESGNSDSSVERSPHFGREGTFGKNPSGLFAGSSSVESHAANRRHESRLHRRPQRPTRRPWDPHPPSSSDHSNDEVNQILKRMGSLVRQDGRAQFSRPQLHDSEPTPDADEPDPWNDNRSDLESGFPNTVPDRDRPPSATIPSTIPFGWERDRGASEPAEAKAGIASMMAPASAKILEDLKRESSETV
jgi:hypothetical protein